MNTTIINTLVGGSARVTTPLGKVFMVHDIHKTPNGHVVGFRDSDGALVQIGWSDMGHCTPAWISAIESA